MEEAIRLLAVVRKDRGLRQVDVAALTGIGQQEISRYESGRFITFRALTRYAEALGYEVDLVLRKRAPDRTTQ